MPRRTRRPGSHHPLTEKRVKIGIAKAEKIERLARLAAVVERREVEMRHAR